MPTSSFDKNFIITDPETVERLYRFMEDNTPAPWPRPVPDAVAFEEGKRLLKECLARSKKADGNPPA